MQTALLKAPSWWLRLHRWRDFFSPTLSTSLNSKNVRSHYARHDRSKGVTWKSPHTTEPDERRACWNMQSGQKHGSGSRFQEEHSALGRIAFIYRSIRASMPVGGIHSEDVRPLFTSLLRLGEAEPTLSTSLSSSAKGVPPKPKKCACQLNEMQVRVPAHSVRTTSCLSSTLSQRNLFQV